MGYVVRPSLKKRRERTGEHPKSDPHITQTQLTTHTEGSTWVWTPENRTQHVSTAACDLGTERLPTCPGHLGHRRAGIYERSGGHAVEEAGAGEKEEPPPPVLDPKAGHTLGQPIAPGPAAAGHTMVSKHHSPLPPRKPGPLEKRPILVRNGVSTR